MNITVNEILDALAAASTATVSPDTHSGPAIRAALGVGPVAFAEVMGPLIESGAVLVVRRRHVAIDGRTANTPAYLFVR